jgi:hypothetical protein
MRFGFQRHLKGQTRLGVFQNLRFPGDCGGIKYVAVHLGTWRLEWMWEEKRRHYPSVSTCGYMRG